MSKSRLHPAIAIGVLFLLLMPAHVMAAVTTFTTKAGFVSATGAGLVVDFESRSGAQPNPFSVTFAPGFTMSFSSPNSMFVISPATPGTTSPLPTSHMLSASGIEDFTLTFPSAAAIGFVLLNNNSGPHTVTLTDINNATFVYHPTQAHNTIGFIGFASTIPIVKLRWQSVNGAVQNTALDDIHYLSLSVPTTTTSWSRVKQLYR